MKKIFFIVLLFGVTLFAQDKNPDNIIKKAQERFSAVKDYEVNVNIKIDVEFLKVPETNATIYFKQPDKIKVKSEGFALVPKEGLNFSPQSLLKNPYTAIYKTEEWIEGRQNAVVQIIPTSGQSNFVIATLWIDRNENYVSKVEATSKNNGTFNLSMKYDLGKTKYALPVKMVFTFNVDSFNMPKALSGENGNKKNKKESNKPTRGTVYINYSNYKINIGVPDNVFTDK